MTCNSSSTSQLIPAIYRTRYDDWSFVFKFLEDDRVTPIDITDWTFKFAVYQGSKQLFEYETGDPELVVDLPNAKVTISVPGTETDLPPTATYTYFLQYKDALLKQHTPIKDAPLIVMANKQL